MAKNTLAELKRRLQVGAQLVCLEHTLWPKHVGMDHTILTVKTNGYFYTSTRDTLSKRFWCDMPKAKDLQWIDANTFRVSLGHEHYKVMAFCTKE
jgi:hypothetical protein